MRRARQPALLAALVTGRLPKPLAFLHLLAGPAWRRLSAMARALDEIVRLDRRWFWAHPQRRHRYGWPDWRELVLCEIRHLGRGRVVCQPVIFPGALPTDERSAAALFALAATSPEPIPVIAQMEVLATNRSQHLSGRWCVAVPPLVVFG